MQESKIAKVSTNIYDVIVIGEGPAGMSASLFLKRANIDVLMLENATPGGKLIWTSSVENYPGFRKNSGVDLATIMHSQIKEENVETYRCEVVDIERLNNGTFNIITTKETFNAKYVIFAGGTKVKHLCVPGEDTYLNKGISFCAMCEGNLYENQDVCVIGGGTSGFEEAIYLTKICKSVTLISRSDHYKAAPCLVERAKNIKNMNIMNNKTIKEFIGNDYHLTGIIIEDKITKKEEIINTNGVFIYIGFEPTTKMFEKFGLVDEKGYIYVDESLETKVPGIYAAGDCVHKTIRQVITAVSDGVIAAAAVTRKL